MGAAGRPVQKERAGIDHSRRLQVLWQQLSMQHNFDKYMLQNQAEYQRVFGMLEHVCERALRRAADGRHPWRKR
jgi:hypothetical protein